MRNKKMKIILLVLVIAIGAVVGVVMIKGKGSSKEVTKEINPTIGSIETFISTTGTVLPQNRLEVKPPVNGRIESILVQEGEKVKTGQILASMSSTDNCASELIESTLTQAAISTMSPGLTA